MANGQIEVKLGIVNPAAWADVDQESPFPLQQHPTYGRALEQFGASTAQATILLDGLVIARALLVNRKFFGLLDFTTVFRGPVWCQPSLDETTKQQAIAILKQQFSAWRWNFLCAMPELASTDTNLGIMRRAGYQRVMSGFSTAWVDLRPEEPALRASLHGKWRNQLSKAEKTSIQISVGGRKAHQYNWLLEKEAEQRSNRRYQATPLGLVPAYTAAVTGKSNSGIVSITALQNRKKIAGALFLLHGNSATYHIGWAGEEGRAVNAQNKVLWEGMCALKTAGIDFLDLGGLNTQDLAGIARFKLGIGAPPVTLAGAFI